MKKSAAQTAPGRAPFKPALTSGVWNVQLLGGLRASSGDVVVQSFKPRSVACLLARLAMDPQRDHAREELADLLWPQRAGQPPLSPDTLRNRLRNTLSLLNSLLHAPGHAASRVVQGTGPSLRVAPNRLQCDVQQFAALAAQAPHNPQAALQARALYKGELMPGYNEDWVRDRRNQLADLYDSLPAPGALPAALQRRPEARPEARIARPTVLHLPAQTSPAAQPPLRQMPNYLNTFVGRSDETRRLTAGLKQHRVLGLVGPGGCGKTRLSVHWAQHDARFDSLVFVPLQDCSAASEVMNHIRAELGLKAAGRDRPIIEQIEDRLRGHQALLILDCCEHLLGKSSASTGAVSAAKAVQPRANRATMGASSTAQDAFHGQLQALLQRLPGLSVLLTSRKAFGPAVPQITLRPLPLPAPGATAQQAWSVDSVALFIDRARIRRGDINLHARNVASVIDLCTRLDGLPVFIEIAASRVRQFSPAKMCAELATSLAQLKRTGPDAKRAGHHATGQALLQWSWKLLTPPLQAMWAAVATFRSGWTLAAAADVAQCTLAQASSRLQALVDHSLVHSELGPTGTMRWTMLGVVRELVQARVPADQARVYRERLREHLLAWAQSLHARHAAFEKTEWPNVELALETAMADGEPGTAVTLCLALQWPWVAVGPSQRTVQLLQQLALHFPAEKFAAEKFAAEKFGAGAGDTQANDAAAFHSLRVRMLMHGGQGTLALQAAKLALKCAGRRPAARADALLAATSAKWRSNGDGAAVLDDAHEALHLARLAGATETQARAAVILGAITAMHLQDFGRARTLFLMARALFISLGDEAGALSVEPGLIVCLMNQKKYLAAITRAKRTLVRARTLDQIELQFLMFNRLGNCHEEMGQLHEAVQINQQQLKLARQHALGYHQGTAVWNLCLPLMRLNQPEKALRLMGFAQRLWSERFGEIDSAGQTDMQTLRALGEQALGRALCTQRWKEGAALTDRQGLNLAGS